MDGGIPQNSNKYYLCVSAVGRHHAVLVSGQMGKVQPTCGAQLLTATPTSAMGRQGAGFTGCITSCSTRAHAPKSPNSVLIVRKVLSKKEKLCFLGLGLHAQVGEFIV